MGRRAQQGNREKNSYRNIWQEKQTSFKGLCEKYGISEKTGHKWKNRFFEYGYAGICDRSRTPENSPSKLDEDMVIRVN